MHTRRDDNDDHSCDQHDGGRVRFDNRSKHEPHNRSGYVYDGERTRFDDHRHFNNAAAPHHDRCAIDVDNESELDNDDNDGSHARLDRDQHSDVDFGAGNGFCIANQYNFTPAHWQRRDTVRLVRRHRVARRAHTPVACATTRVDPRQNTELVTVAVVRGLLSSGSNISAGITASCPEPIETSIEVQP